MFPAIAALVATWSLGDHETSGRSSVAEKSGTPVNDLPPVLFPEVMILIPL